MTELLMQIDFAMNIVFGLAFIVLFFKMYDKRKEKE